MSVILPGSVCFREPSRSALNFLRPLHGACILAAFALLTPSAQVYGQCVMVPVLCDADGDRNVDHHDIDAITNAEGTLVEPGDVRDIDADGEITAQDALQCVAQCDFGDCGDVQDKPNILVLMADDLGFNDLAINNGNTNIDTPNMDQLAQDGVRFTRHYAATVCSPARAAFLSGMYPERLGYSPNGIGISPEVVTMPDRLSDVGYTTWHIGKWHIGDLERTAWPDYQGFDHWFGFLNQWLLEGLHIDGELQSSNPTYLNPWLQGDTEAGQNFTGHLENILADKAIEVLTDLNTEQAPWFLNVWFFAPHAPLMPASEHASLYPDTETGKFQALVNQLDTNIGRILAHLEGIGALQDTIIVMVSDNGGTNAVLDNNYPYSGKKTQIREGGLRTPLIIQWTDQTLNGQVFSDTVSIEDIYPSLMAAIELDPPDNLDGNSFYQSVAQQIPAVEKDRFNELGEITYGGLSADGRWRLFQPPPYLGVQPVPRIYDLDLDPTAASWVVPAPQPELDQMLASYDTWYRDVHTVQTEFTATPYGGTLKGMSFMRTPGFQEYTFGIAISDDFDGQIAAQTGIWEIRRAGNSVTAQYGDLILSGDIDNGDSCHSVVVTGVFERQLRSQLPPDRIMLALYIDGNEEQAIDIESSLVVANPYKTTFIGDPGYPGQPGTIAEPVILNVSLDRTYGPLTPQSFSQELCQAL